MIDLAVGLAALAGCSDNSNELNRLVCEVASVNNGAPWLSAVPNLGNDGAPGARDDFTSIDWVPVIFRARACNSTMNIPDDGTYSSFIITGYDLAWSSSDPNAPATLLVHNITGGVLSAKVPIDVDSIFSVLVSPLEMKGAAWFQNIYNGTAPSFTANARLTFKGHVSGTDHMVEVPAGLMVNFIGTVVD